MDLTGLGAQNLRELTTMPTSRAKSSRSTVLRMATQNQENLQSGLNERLATSWTCWAVGTEAGLSSAPLFRKGLPACPAWALRQTPGQEEEGCAVALQQMGS